MSSIPPTLPDKEAAECTPTASHATTPEALLEKNPESVKEKKQGLTRRDTTLIFLTNQIGLGILSLPHALRTLGIIPGIFAIIAFGLLAGYTGYVLLQFYKKHPTIVNIADVGREIGGLPLQIVVGAAFWTNLCICGASCLTTMSIGLNNMSEHAMCTINFLLLAALVSFLFCLPRAMGIIAKMGYPATVSIFVAIFVVIASLRNHVPQNAPPQFVKEIQFFGHPTFAEGMIAILNICFAYAGTQSYVTIMAEMRAPLKDFLPSLCFLQGFTIVCYTVLAAVMYALAAQFTTSPIIGSADKLSAKIAYGLAIPCILGSAMVFGNTGTKFAFVVTMRLLKADDAEINNHGSNATRRSWLIWGFGCTVFWVFAFILANSIPVFSLILSIVSSIFVAWFTFGIPSVAWLHMNQERMLEGWAKLGLTILNIVIIAVALIMNSAGMYAAIIELLRVFQDPNATLSGAWSCADNGIFRPMQPLGVEV